MPEILSLSDARAAGLKRYFTGRPCRHGHISERLVSNWGCITCAYASFKRFYAENADRMVSRSAAYKEENRGVINERKCAMRLSEGSEIRAKAREEYARNAERERARTRRYRNENPEACKASQRKWKLENRARATAIQIERQAAKLKATPAWADREAIEKIYAEANSATAATGIPHEVDHYYPLRGKLVCGLHVETNLRVVTKAFNLAKSNHMPEEFQ